MRITESRLRRLINNVISEMSDMMPSAIMPQQAMPVVGGVDYGMSSFMDKALACCSMPTKKLFDMCAQICAKNESMSGHCAELCVCACREDDIGAIGCCRCLEKICSCPECYEICKTCCNC